MPAVGTRGFDGSDAARKMSAVPLDGQLPQPSCLECDVSIGQLDENIRRQGEKKEEEAGLRLCRQGETGWWSENNY